MFIKFAFESFFRVLILLPFVFSLRPGKREFRARLNIQYYVGIVVYFEMCFK